MTAHTGRIGAAVVVIAETIVFVALVTLPGTGRVVRDLAGIDRARPRKVPCHRAASILPGPAIAHAIA